MMVGLNLNELMSWLEKEIWRKRFHKLKHKHDNNINFSNYRWTKSFGLFFIKQQVCGFSLNLMIHLLL
jgi:hypothetical protein